MKKFAIAAIAIGVALGATACSAPVATPTPTHTAVAPKLTGTITVYGAASLTATFTTLATDFKAANPAVTVQTTFNGSAVLVTQIKSGAPADVFASADEPTMAMLTTGTSLISGKPVDFATNVLEIAVPVGNPAGIKTFADLAKPGVKTVVCAVAVPCGAATQSVETATGVTITPVSEETSVTDVLAKVESGEADAGLVYVTDVKGAAGKVDGVNFSAASKAVNTYPIGALKSSANPTVAAAFVKYVTGPKGQAILKTAGFGKP
jgi:molybdate transport system substrate-binding protein